MRGNLLSMFGLATAVAMAAETERSEHKKNVKAVEKEMSYDLHIKGLESATVMPRGRYNIKRGASPRLWGEWLQHTGRQKWVKRKK